MNQSKYIIALAGGGTGGPTTPLLAIAEEIQRSYPDTELLFIGTDSGPEKELVKQQNILFTTIPAAKMRRYFSLRNIMDVFVLPIAIFKAIFILLKHRVDCIVSVGGFVSVPV